MPPRKTKATAKSPAKAPAARKTIAKAAPAPKAVAKKVAAVPERYRTKPTELVHPKAVKVPKNLDIATNDKATDSYVAAMNMPHIRDPILEKYAKKMNAKAIPTYWKGTQLEDWEEVTGEKLGAHMLKHMDPKRKSIFTPAIGTTDKYTHYNSVIIDPAKKRVKIFDPAVSRTKTMYTGGGAIRADIQKALKDYKVIAVSPAKNPAQAGGDSFCQTQSLKFLAQKAKGKSDEHIKGKLDIIPAKQAGDVANKKILSFASKQINSNRSLREEMTSDMKHKDSLVKRLSRR